MKTNYTTEQDYDPDDVDWLEITRIGSVYEEQVARDRDLWRHRDAMNYGPWVRGQAPDNKPSPTP
jgi:hypothetical protein